MSREILRATYTVLEKDRERPRLRLTIQKENVVEFTEIFMYNFIIERC